MKLTLALPFLTAASLTAAAGASNVYLLSSGDPTTDNAAVAALTSHGHTVTVGLQYDAFDGSVNLSGYQTVYLQCNANWTSITVMPVAGQQQLVDWVNAGGRLVTSEWVIYYSYASGGKFGTLGPIIPAVQASTYGGILTATYAVVTPDSRINAGLPSAFQFPLTSYAGTETFTTAKPGATTYYSTNNSPNAAGLVGWSVGAGSVFSFTSTCGQDQVGDTNFGRLFSNVMGAGSTAPCYANCDGSTIAPILNVNDFICFQTKFAAGDSYANCDNSNIPPVLNVNDFICFQTKYAAGCP